jgi:hypothetical protein
MNINQIYQEYIQEYILDFISILFLSGTIYFLFVNTYYNPLLQYNKIINTLSQNYKKEELKLYKQVYAVEQTKENQEIKLDTIPALLVRINNTCIAPKVIIRTLVPNKDNPFRFKLKFISTYFNFLTVLSEFEKLNIAINKIDIKPYEIKEKEARHIITLDISAIDGGHSLSKENIAFLTKELQKKEKRDPFQRFAKIGKTIKRLVDLTWIHKLSGIGRIDGQYVATINHRVYYKNSKFNDMIITDITSKSVLLKKKTSNGIVNYILNFRLHQKKKDETKE